MDDITRPRASGSGLSEMLGGTFVAVVAIVLSIVLDRPTFWYFVLFTLGVIIALVGVARLAQYLKRRNRSTAHKTDAD